MQNQRKSIIDVGFSRRFCRVLTSAGLCMAVILPLLAVIRPAAAKDWYVATNGSASYDGTSPVYLGGTRGPWSTIAKACNWPTFARAGDTIHVMPGTYVSTKTSPAGCGHSGTANAPIIFRGEGVAPNLTRITNDGTTASVIISGSYQTWSNFEITTNAPVGSLSNPNSQNVYDCVMGTPGGSLSKPAVAPLIGSTISGNVIHGCGGNGISFFNSDYIFIRYNTIYGNAHTTTYARNSGISILGAADSDASTGYKIIINSNIIHTNTNIPNCAASNADCLQSAGDSDGNGIILDSSDVRYDNYTSGLYPGFYGPPYHGRTIVLNNLIFGNGGRCIHEYRTRHVDILNNTCYGNLQDPHFSAETAAEIDAVGGYSDVLLNEPHLVTKLGLTNPAISGGDENIYNNSITTSGNKGAQHPASGCISFAYARQSATALNNHCYVMTGARSQASIEMANFPGVQMTIDPSLSTTLFRPPPFIEPKINPAIANFHPTRTTPLIAASNNALGYIAQDLAGVTRSTTAMTLGAYER